MFFSLLVFFFHSFCHITQSRCIKVYLISTKRATATYQAHLIYGARDLPLICNVCDVLHTHTHTRNYNRTKSIPLFILQFGDLTKLPLKNYSSKLKLERKEKEKTSSKIKYKNSSLFHDFIFFLFFCLF